MRDPWNLLDLFVVIISVLEIVGGDNVNNSFKGLRTFRILRPLRSINSMPSMKRLIKTLFGSLPSLIDVLIFLMFIFVIFGIFGVQTFQGKLYSVCRETLEPLVTETDTGTLMEWPYVDGYILCN
jgi:hypothetical protein